MVDPLIHSGRSTDPQIHWSTTYHCGSDFNPMELQKLILIKQRALKENLIFFGEYYSPHAVPVHKINIRYRTVLMRMPCISCLYKPTKSSVFAVWLCSGFWMLEMYIGCISWHLKKPSCASFLTCPYHNVPTFDSNIRQEKKSAFYIQEYTFVKKSYSSSSLIDIFYLIFF